MPEEKSEAPTWAQHRFLTFDDYWQFCNTSQPWNGLKEVQKYEYQMFFKSSHLCPGHITIVICNERTGCPEAQTSRCFYTIYVHFTFT